MVVSFPQHKPLLRPNANSTVAAHTLLSAKTTERNQIIWLTYMLIASKVKDTTKYAKITNCVTQPHMVNVKKAHTWAEMCSCRTTVYQFINNSSCALKDMSFYYFTIESTQQDATNESLECGLMTVVYSASTNPHPPNEHWHTHVLLHILLCYEDQQYVYAVYRNTRLLWESKQTHRHSVSRPASWSLTTNHEVPGSISTVTMVWVGW